MQHIYIEKTTKHYLRQESKVIQVKYYQIVIYQDICKNMINKTKKLFYIISHLPTHYNFKQNFQNVDQHTVETK